MFKSDDTTTSMTVKISALSPGRSPAQVFVDGALVNTAAPAGRQQGDYLYTASVTILRENDAVYTTAPFWASVEVERENAARPAAGMRDHVLLVESFNPYEGGTA